MDIFYLKLETLIIVSLIIHTINGQNPINSEMSSNKQIKLPEEEKDKTGGLNGEFLSLKIGSECFGSYNREIIKELENICHDCRNVFRDLSVVSCKRRCFQNSLFNQCLKALNRPVKKYQQKVQNLAVQSGSLVAT
ncbi:UNVERIFIED_CONTAM: hypothetical protein RMT77_009243 [Armadillidium vulgare]